MTGSWIDGVKEKFLTPCHACQEELNVCMCPSTAAFRTILVQVTSELEKSWQAEADAWNRGYDVARKQFKGRR